MKRRITRTRVEQFLARAWTFNPRVIEQLYLLGILSEEEATDMFFTILGL